MYVRWQSRKREIYSPTFGPFWKDGERVYDTHWRAILVESVRVDGKPTQRHIAYLAGFTESAVAIPEQQRFLWDRIGKQLDRLHNRITPEDRERIEATIVAKVGNPPTKCERDQFDREARQTFGDDWCDKEYGKEFGR